MNCRFAAITALAVLAAPVASADDSSTAEKEPLRGLLVTGGCCHDYPRQTEIITKGMNERIGPVRWTVVNYGTERSGELSVYADPHWADGFDLVVHNECYGGVTDPAIVARIVGGHVRSGVPGVAIHCSMHSYRDAENADLWRALIGATSTRHERGNRRLSVVPSDADHPVMPVFPANGRRPTVNCTSSSGRGPMRMCWPPRTATRRIVPSRSHGRISTKGCGCSSRHSGTTTKRWRAPSGWIWSRAGCNGRWKNRRSGPHAARILSHPTTPAEGPSGASRGSVLRSWEVLYGSLLRR